MICELADFGTNTHIPELYLLSFGHFYLIWNLKQWLNITQACAFVPKFANLSQQSMKSQL